MKIWTKRNKNVQYVSTDLSIFGNVQTSLEGFIRVQNSSRILFVTPEREEYIKIKKQLAMSFEQLWRSFEVLRNI